MIRVLFYVAAFCLLAFGAAWLIDTPGEIAVTLPGRKVSTTLLGGVAALLALAVAIILVWSIVRLVLRLPAMMSLGSRARRRARGYAAVSRGMVAVGAGDPRAARRHAEDATRLLGREPLALLLKAQAAQMAGDRTTAEGTFRQMLDDSETRVLGLRGLFVEARRKGDTAAARAYAAEASRIAPTVGWAGEALLEYQCADRDWRGAMLTLDRGARGLDKASVRRQRAVLLTAAALDRGEGETEAALSDVREALKLVPDLVPAAVLAGRLHARRGELRKASRVIEQAWQRQTHPDLAAAYVEIRAGDSARDRLARAERLLALRPGDAEGRIAVAGAAISARDFDRARAVLRPLAESEPGLRVCLLMADLAEYENQDAGTVREWLARASRAPRDPAWIADGVISDRWAPVSPVTGRLDAFVWGQPMESLAAPAPRPRPVPLPPPDTVVADVDEVPAAVLAPPAPPAQPVAPAAPVAEAPPPAAPAAESPSAAPAASAPPADRPPSGTAPADPARDAGREPEAAPSAARKAETPAAGGGTVVPLPAPVAGDPRRKAKGQPGEVVFPMPAPPDDPGPDRGESAARGRATYLQ